MNFKEIHIGELIRKIVKEDQLDPYKLCSYLEISEVELSQMYHSKSLDSELLLKWSKLIKYDLFRVYSQHLLFMHLQTITSTLQENLIARYRCFVKISTQKKSLILYWN